MFPSYAGGSGYGGLAVPYQTSISPSLAPGTQIHVSGTPTGSRFEVNLKGHNDNIVLHVNPRLDDRALALNSSQQGAWGQEERHSLPLQRGVRFTMVIMATDSGFNISINNAHLCAFSHRASMYSAQLVEVKGDITLESAQVYGGGMGGSGGFPQMGGGMGFPQMGGAMGFPQAGVNVSFGHTPQPPFGGGHTPHPPFGGDYTHQPPPFGGGFNTSFVQPSAPSVFPTQTFPMGGGSGVPSIQSCRIHTGSRIFVRGFIPPGANRFELNLLQGYQDSDDVAFHFNPRFDTRQIVKNHRRGGQWGQEENQPFPSYMPLMPGAAIDLQIACTQDRYTVLMNNQPIAEFHHKIPPGHVMALQYKGDITVTSVGQM